MRKLNEYIKLQAREQNTEIFSVSAYLGEDNITTYTTGAGVSKNTAINIGEITHLIISMLALKLIEEGELSFSDKVSDILDKYPAADVRVSDLFEFTAGYSSEEFCKRLPPEATADEYLNCFYSYCPENCGTEKSPAYFPEGYVLIAAIIEKLTGKNIEQFAKETLYLPLNLRNTTFNGKNTDKSRYKLTDNYSEAELSRSGSCMHNHVLSTTEDLVKIASVLINGGKYQGKRIFSKAGIEQIASFSGIEAKRKVSDVLSVRSMHKDGCLSDLNSDEAICIKSSTGGMLMIDRKYKIISAILTDKSKIDSRICRKINTRLLCMLDD